MSLTFKNVPNVSKRQGRSQSRRSRIYRSTNYRCTTPFQGDEDDFPPLRKFMDVDYSPDVIFKSSSEFEATCCDYFSQNNPNSGQQYSQCLIKNKFCCQKNQNQKSDAAVLYKKSIGNILGDLKTTILTNNSIQPNTNNFKFNNFTQFSFGNQNNAKAAMKSPIVLQRQRSFNTVTENNNNNQLNVPPCTRSISNLTLRHIISPENSYTNTLLKNRDVKSPTEHPALLSKISEEPLKPVKQRSIHTINDLSQPTQVHHHTPIISPPEKRSTPYVVMQQEYQPQTLFPNTTWFLQENLSDQFGFNEVLNSVQPVFEDGNMYAECYDCPTVAPDLFRTTASDYSPVFNKKKDFKTLFSPYSREKLWL